MEFDPPAARRAGAELDALADRLEDALRMNSPALAVAPAGTDEVSIRTAQTLREVAVSYVDAGHRGVSEIRKLAATLRVQTEQLVRMDGDNAAAFGTPV
ncbi:PE family protein [Nocardia carnea]|uniref:PE family protein n=1 Tax=Nocardia carnea TaxID=37328 RepID=UPI0024553F44|nr:PE family protein [Nocardia carnea]